MNDVELEDRIYWQKEKLELEESKVGDLKRKARVKWIKDGDENSNIFHNSITHNIKSLQVNGLLVNRDWSSDPVSIK